MGVLVGAITLGTIEPKDAVTNGVLLWHELQEAWDVMAEAVS